MKQLVFERSAIKHNTAIIQERAGSAVIFAVLVGDAYGAGLIELAKLLREEGIAHFAVEEAEDVARLRQAGFAQEPILMLRSTTNRDELVELLNQRAICTIGSYETGTALNAVAEELGVKAEAHVLIDTGMGFGGFLSSEPQKLLSIYHYLPNVAITGTYTHLCAYAGDTTRQMAVFQSVLDTIQSAHLNPGLVHAAGSSALMNGTDTCLGAVRVGSAFLGACRTQKRGSQLRPVYHGEAILDTVRWLPRGTLWAMRSSPSCAVLPAWALFRWGISTVLASSVPARAGSGRSSKPGGIAATGSSPSTAKRLRSSAE